MEFARHRIDVGVAQTVISEVGLEMSRWEDEHHFASWLGLCPDNRITGGKVEPNAPERGCGFGYSLPGSGPLRDLFNKGSHSMCRTTRPTATAVSVCRLSALTNVRPRIDTRAANSCAEAT